MAKLLLVDDDPLIHDRVENCFSVDDHDIIHAMNVSEARSALKEQMPDICLLDLVMPGMSGKAFCKEISEEHNLGIIVIYSLDSRNEQIKLLELGADDYIVKPFDDLELRARVNSLARRIRRRPVSIDRGHFSGGRFSFDERRLERVDGTSVTLTSGEASVLSFMLNNIGAVLSREDLLAVSRTRQHGGPEDRSVDNLMRRLRRKVEIDPSKPKHVITVWGRGYRFVA